MTTNGDDEMIMTMPVIMIVMKKVPQLNTGAKSAAAADNV